MKRLEPHDRMMLVGVTGSGKSYFLKHEILADYNSEGVAAYPRRVVWDWHCEHSTAHYTVDELERAIYSKKFTPSLHTYVLAVKPTRTIDDPFGVASFLKFCRIVEAHFKDALLIIEEAGVFDESAKAKQALVYIATQFRHFGIPIVFVAQYAFLIPKGVRRQTTRIVSFRQVEKSDLEALRERMEIVDELPTLGRGEYREWSAGAF